MPEKGRRECDGTAAGLREPHIPPGYESVYTAAARSGQNVQVLKRRLRRGEIEGAYKIAWRGGGLWVVPVDARIPDLGGGRIMDEKTRQEIVGRARAGERKAPLAREFGVDRSYIYKLLDKYAAGDVIGDAICGKDESI